MNKLTLILLIAIIFLGCEDKTVTHLYQKKIVGSHIKTLSLANTEPQLITLIKPAIKKAGFTLKDGSPYTIMIESRKYSHHCNNPLTPAYDATYDGFIKLHLSQGLKELYSIQEDFHGELDTDKIASLLQKMKNDLQLK